MPDNQQQQTNANTTEVDPLAADRAILAAAQAKLAEDQAGHDENQKALDAATESHAAAHIALQNDQAALAAAQQKLAEDQAALDAKTAALTSAPVTSAPVHESIVAEAEAHVQEMEAIAVKWGGDIGIDLRNLVGKLRSLLGLGTPAA